MCMVFANTITLMVKWAGEPVSVSHVTDILNYVFLSIFTFEMVIKVTALGLRVYFRDRWNMFDFGVIVLTFGCIALANTT